MDSLKPCPFCGSESVSAFARTCNRDTPYNAADRAFPSVRCQICYAETPGENWGEKASAIKAWNQRAAPKDTPNAE